MHKTTIAMLLAIAASAVWSLASGAPYRGSMLPGGLPLVNALAALGLCAAAGTAVRLRIPGTGTRVAPMPRVSRLRSTMAPDHSVQSTVGAPARSGDS
ncbi:MAG TPA: hypothetical protein VIL60_09160 [Rhodanobacter sp.]